jgi:L-threonylcarbamoyladenylate synthase
MLERYVPDFHPVCYDLADLADKPLTIIYPSAKGLAPSVLASDGTVGIRITKDPICLKLIRSLKKPIVSTSANISGQSSPVSFNDIDEQIKNGVDAILEERLSEQMIQPSQIIKIGLNGAVKVIRK